MKYPMLLLLTVFLFMNKSLCVAASVDGVYVRARFDDLSLEGVRLAPKAGSNVGLDLRFAEYSGSFGGTSLLLREGDVVMRDPESPSTKVEAMHQWEASNYRATMVICSESASYLIAIMIDGAPREHTEKRSPGIYLSLRGSDRKTLADKFEEFLLTLELSLDGVDFSPMRKTGLQIELVSILDKIRK